MSNATDHLTETAAEIAALIPKYSWEIMDEEQRDDLMVNVVLPRYGKKTADGVNLGPSFWSEITGARAKAIESRVYRLRQSQKSDSEQPSRALSDSRVRHARSALSDPDSRREVFSSLPSEQIEDLIEEATEASYKRQEAQRSESRTAPTVRELEDGEPFRSGDLIKTWVDPLVTSLWGTANKLVQRVQKHGRRAGHLSPDEILERLTEIERIVGEERAAWQEIVQDERLSSEQESKR